MMRRMLLILATDQLKMYAMKISRLSKIVCFAFLLFVLSACNKQKAESLKIAAQQFRTEAILSIDQLNELFIQSSGVFIPTDEEDIEQIINDLNAVGVDDINADLLNVWTVVAEDVLTETNKEFEKIKVQYYQFEAMFTSLEKGSFFAKDAVKKAEKHAINLTVQLINFSEMMESQEFQFTSQRIRLIEKMKSAKALPNEALQQEYFKRAATEYVLLKKEEKIAKNKAVIQCLKAAQAGKTVSDLIRNYDKMNLNDILNSIENSISYVNNITNGKEEITQVLGHFQEIRTTVQNDPYWAPLLEQEIIN